MIDDFSKHCQHSALAEIHEQLISLSKASFLLNNGNIQKWEYALEQIQTNSKGYLSYQAPYLHIETHQQHKLENALKQFMPWRKGPYRIGNLTLDSEWRGDLKWQRLIAHIKPLKGKTVLDIGASNGYFTYLMAIMGAKTALGIEPFLLFNYQFKAIRSLIKNPPNAFVLPLRLEQMPDTNVFDTVFSMGILYHQKDHMVHLHKLKQMLANGGELILETLVVDKAYAPYIIPKERYAKMRNVYCLPSTDTLRMWLNDAGFKKIKLVDVNQTTFIEQRATHWIGNKAQSLQDFLNPNDINLTIEGLPAPKRAIFICAQ